MIVKTAPILFIVFNRPGPTAQVLDILRKVRPTKMYVAGDGPRPGNSTDSLRCKEVRRLISTIDWNCQLKTLYRDTNLGCGKAVSSAISWFFANESKGIILEDDCVPNISFFPFCSELLEKYESDERVMHIGGLNWLNGRYLPKSSYYFSAYPTIWGWATWRDRWAKFSLNLKDDAIESLVQSGKLARVSSDRTEMEYHLKTFRKAKVVDTWDYQWKFTVFNSRGLCVIPSVNLVTNVGFGEDATHTIGSNDSSANRDTCELSFPIKHPSSVGVNIKADRIMGEVKFNRTKHGVNWVNRFKSFYQRFLIAING